MKHILILFLLFQSGVFFAQKSGGIQLQNVLIVGQLDNESERFSLEVMLTQFFTERGVKSVPSMNVLKQGSDISLLGEDSLKKVVTDKGLDTYMLVSVRGYDRRFKRAENRDDFKTALDYGTLFSLYRPEAVSVTFEIFLYRNETLIKTVLVKCGNVSSRESVLKRLDKKLDKAVKRW
jgi:hypothetical protein